MIAWAALIHENSATPENANPEKFAVLTNSAPENSAGQLKVISVKSTSLTNWAWEKLKVCLNVTLLKFAPRINLDLEKSTDISKDEPEKFASRVKVAFLKTTSRS